MVILATLNTHALYTMKVWNTYILFDGFTYNMHGYFASCVAKCLRVLYVKLSNKRFIIPLQKGVILIQFYLVRVF